MAGDISGPKRVKVELSGEVAAVTGAPGRLAGGTRTVH